MRTKEEILQGEDETKFMLKCSLDPLLFFTRVLGKTAKHFHKEWFQILNTYNRIAISAPTGFGKTCVFGVSYPLWLVYFRPQSQVLILSKSIRTQSAGVLEEIKQEIEENEMLQCLLPNDTKQSWTKEKINMSNGSKIFYSSFSQNVRGVHVNYIFCDEVATFDDSTLFFRDVVTRAAAKKGTIAAVSTPIHTEDLLAQLLNNKEYFTKKYPAVVKGESIWPEKFGIPVLEALRSEQGESNYQKNYMCNPRSEAENTIFPLGKVMEMYDSDIGFTTDYEGRIFIGCDFAISKGPRADFDAYVVLEKLDNHFTIKHIETHRGFPTPAKIRRIKHLYELYSKIEGNPTRIILDDSGIGVDVAEGLRIQGVPAKEQSFHSIARTRMLMNLRNLIDSKRIIFPYIRDMSKTRNLIEDLTTQLIGFAETKSKLTGNITYASRAAHDDIAMALALAAKEGVSQKQTGIYIASSS